MPIEHVAGTNLDYYFAAFDADSRERPDDPDGPMSDRIVSAAGDPAITDIFIFAHGWRHSLGEAQRQYGEWIRQMAAQTADINQMRALRPGFRPLLVGLHWPSEPGLAALRGLSPQDQQFTLRDRVMATFSDLFGNETRTQDALAAIAAGVEQSPTSLTLSSAEQDGYAILAQDADIVDEQAAGPREDVPPPLDPEFIIKRTAGEARTAQEAGFLSKLSPLALLSFWKMKRRARIFGGGAAHQLLVRVLQQAGPDVRVHLMGHSFGCIVVSGMLIGSLASKASALPRPIQSLTLVQGALSAWSFCSDLPHWPGHPGHFHSIIANNLVDGPLLTTRSKHDQALNLWYWLGTLTAKDVDFAPWKETWNDALGLRGAQGPGIQTENLALASTQYQFKPGVFYNLEGKDVIREGDWLSGAHGDFVKPEVAHAVWSAAAPRS